MARVGTRYLFIGQEKGVSVTVTTFYTRYFFLKQDCINFVYQQTIFNGLTRRAKQGTISWNEIGG